MVVDTYGDAGWSALERRPLRVILVPVHRGLPSQNSCSMVRVLRLERTWNPNYFHKLRRHDDFAFVLSEMDIETDRLGRYARAFRRVEEPPTNADYAAYFHSQDDDTDAE